VAPDDEAAAADDFQSLSYGGASLALNVRRLANAGNGFLA